MVSVTLMGMWMASPAAAFRWWRLPAKGVGLARMEFIISAVIKAHPMALVRFDTLQDGAARQQIEALTRGFADKPAYFVDTLARGIAWFDQFGLHRAITGFVTLIGEGATAMRTWQNGFVRSYALGVFAGALVLTLSLLAVIWR